MLAQRMPSILPDLSFDEALEVTKIHSIAGLLPKDQPLILNRPFRSPHHTISSAGLSGGGQLQNRVSFPSHTTAYFSLMNYLNSDVIRLSLRQPLEERKRHNFKSKRNSHLPLQHYAYSKYEPLQMRLFR